MKRVHGRIAAFFVALLAMAWAPSAHAAANPVVSPGSLGFGNQQILTTSFNQFVSLSNTGDLPLTVISVSLAGSQPAEFQIQSDGCTGVVLFTGANCFVSVAFAPGSVGVKSAQLRFTHDGPGGTSLASLSGTGVNPAVQISPSTLGYGNQQILTSSFEQFVEVRNIGTGNGPILVGSITLAGTGAAHFVIRNDQCSGVELFTGANCFVQVAFAPTSLGLKNASLSIPTNDPDGPSSAALSGNGVNPAVQINPSSVPFGNVGVGDTSPATFVEVRNIGAGNGPINVGQIDLIGTDASQFVIQNDQCSGVELFTGGNCFVQIAFAPASTGAKTATMRVPSNDPDGPSTVALSGTGISPLTINPTALNFGNVEVGTTSPAQFVTLQNNGTSPISVSSIIMGSPVFNLESDTCSGGIIGPFGGQCFVQVSFSPNVRMVFNSTMTISTSAPGSPHVVSLTGRGVAPDISFSPPSISFGEVEIGETSEAQTLVLTNTGDATLFVTNISIGGSHASEFDIETDTCSGAGIPPGFTCELDLTFAPGGIGARQATLSVTSNVPGAPRTVSLTGTGVDTTAPESFWTTGNNAIVISMLQSVSGTSNDLVGVASVTVTFTDLLGSSMTVPATLTCTNQGRTCSFNATVPLMLPGPATARINATDTSGNTSSGPVIMLLVV